MLASLKYIVQQASITVHTDLSTSKMISELKRNLVKFGLLIMEKSKVPVCFVFQDKVFGQNSPKNWDTLNSGV